METELQDVRTLRITNRELSEACERRAATIDELRGRLELAEQRLDEAEEGKKRSNEMIQALEEACTEMRKELDAEKGSMSVKEAELGRQIDQLIEQGKKDNDECVRLQQVVLALDNRLAKQDQDIRHSLEDEIQQRTKMLAQDHSDKMLQQLAKMNKLEAEFANLQQEHADLQHSTDLLRAKLVTVSEELHRSNTGNGDTAELKNQMQYLQNQLEFSNEQILTLTREQENAHEVVSRLQQTNVDLIAQRNSLETRLMEYTDKYKNVDYPQLGYSENQNSNTLAPPAAPATVLSVASANESEHHVFKQQNTMQRGSPPKDAQYDGEREREREREKWLAVTKQAAHAAMQPQAAMQTFNPTMAMSPPHAMKMPQQQLQQPWM
jgi:chromosome segregation ATPase